MHIWRDIAVFLDGTARGQQIGRRAADIAARQQAHLVGVYGLSQHAAATPAETFARGDHAVGEVMHRLIKADEGRVVAAGRAFAETVGGRAISSEFRVVWGDSESSDVAIKALHSDLIVVTRPAPSDLPGRWTAEHLLLTTGTPVLLVPDAWSGETVGDTIVIAWNGSREARRAVHDAMPMLTQARKVEVVVVDADREPDTSAAEPGVDLLQHLSRHDISAQLQNIASHGGSVADAILAHCAQTGADLLVFGAYSRPRTTELLLGGVTRSLLARAPIPLLMSR